MVGQEPNPYTFARNPLRRAHQWHVVLEYNAMTYSHAAAFVGHLSRGHGGENTFQVPVFAYGAARGSKSGSVTLSGSHAAGLETATITGGTGTFATGDWFHLVHSGVHYAYVCEAAEAGGVVSINPPIRATLATGTALGLLSAGDVIDTMELPPDFDVPTVEAVALYGHPFTVEFLTALR